MKKSEVLRDIFEDMEDRVEGCEFSSDQDMLETVYSVWDFFWSNKSLDLYQRMDSIKVPWDLCADSHEHGFELTIKENDEILLRTVIRNIGIDVIKSVSDSDSESDSESDSDKEIRHYSFSDPTREGVYINDKCDSEMDWPEETQRISEADLLQIGSDLSQQGRWDDLGTVLQDFLKEKGVANHPRWKNWNL